MKKRSSQTYLRDLQPVCDRDKGSISLTSLLSITSGILFTLIFSDIVRYVTVKNALEQSVEKTARCIDPTDPACVSTLTAPSDNQYDWYKTRSGTSSETWVDRYNYSASVSEQQWRITYPAYEIRKVRPELRWEEYVLPRREFQAIVNGFETRNAIVRGDFEPDGSYAPAAFPNFPEFDPQYERVRRDQDPATWKPRALNEFANVRQGSHEIALPLQPTIEFPERVIRSDSPSEFLSDIYPVPLISNTPQQCVNPDGSPCGVAYAAGGNNDWQGTAYIAVKAFAQLTRLAGDPDVKWAGSPTIPDPGTPDGWGLQLETASAAEFSQWQAERDRARTLGKAEPSFPHVECLGGRQWAPVENSRNPLNFHLVLRGAIKRSTDNSVDLEGNAACPGGDVKHWNLAVPRGGVYRIRGWLKVRHGSVRARVNFIHYFDKYLPSAATQLEHCELSVPLTTDQPLPPNDCSICRAQLKHINTPGVTYRNRSCSIETSTEPNCATSEEASKSNRFFPVASFACASPISSAICDKNWLPQTPESCRSGTLPAGRIFCGWQNQSPSTSAIIQSATVPVHCPAASSKTVTAPCSSLTPEKTYNSQADYGEVSTCSNLVAILKEKNQVIDLLNRQQPLLTSSFPAFTEERVSWSQSSDNSGRWVERFRPTDEDGEMITDPNAIRRTTRTRFNSELIYEHKDSSWIPPFSAFGIGDSDAAAIAALGGVSYQLQQNTPRVFNEIYPFQNKPEFEIPSFLPSSSSLQSCSGQAGSVEERLRSYATAVFPPLADQTVQFHVESEYVDSVISQSHDGCGAEELVFKNTPACTPSHSTIRHESTCGTDEYLGRYKISEFPAGPPECHGLQNSHCYSQAVLRFSEETKPRELIQIEAARSQAQIELDRHLPGVLLDCQNPGCAELKINTDSPSTQITLRYYMPLSFPLSTILGQETAVVQVRKEEARETSIIGRFAENKYDPHTSQ